MCQICKIFLNRMSALLHENHSLNRIKFNKNFKRDLKWFNTFLTVLNGVSFLQYPNTKVIHPDACLTGLEAIYDVQVHALQLPESWHNCNIAHLDMINILVALKVWQWAGPIILINCDNQAVVSFLNNARSRDHMLWLSMPEIFLFGSIHVILI